MSKNIAPKRKEISDEDKINRIKSMSEIEHILERAGLYIGDIHTIETNYNLYIPSKNKIETLKNVLINEAILKLFDEIITNSIDERIKSDRIFDINNIHVKIHPNGKFIVRDDGGIPVLKHHEGSWIPEMIFGQLRTSANYGDVREGSGLNGLGAKLTNIFSTLFRVTTCDGKNKFIGEWRNNMSEYKLISIEKCKDKNEHYTEIEFDLELSRFELNTLSPSMMRMFQKRCIDGAGISPNLNIYFEAVDTLDGVLNSRWIFKDFTEFVELHLEGNDGIDMKNSLVYTGQNKDGTHKFDVIIIPSIGYHYGMVNGASCSKGTHMKRIENQLSKHLLDQLLVKENINLITSNDVMNNASIFLSCNIINPFYDSQSKDDLKNNISNTTFSIPKDVLNNLNDGEIYQRLKDFYNTKYEAEKRKLTRKINDELRKAKDSPKLIKCRNKKGNDLFIFEGTSAQGGFKKFRDTDTQMGYMLTGKIKNTIDAGDADLFKNREFKDLIVAQDLRLQAPNLNLQNCTVDRIIIATDADYDGYHITGLFIVFYAIWFPELIQDNRLYRLLAPIGIATKGSGETLEEHFYYSYDDYDKGVEKLGKKGFTFMYKKGLGSLRDDHYERLINEMKLERIVLSENYEKTLRDWFSGSAETRKQILTDGGLFKTIEMDSSDEYNE